MGLGVRILKKSFSGDYNTQPWLKPTDLAQQRNEFIRYPFMEKTDLTANWTVNFFKLDLEYI